METITSRMQAVQSPIIPVVGELIRTHPGTISLGQGVVYYQPPKEAIAQISEFIEDSENHKYKAVEGIPPLLEVIKTKVGSENSIEVNSSNCIVVTAGSNMAFMNAILAITNPGDEIIIQTPYYFNHEMAITMASCRPVPVATDDNYQLSPEAIAQAITDKTRAVVTVSPNNPTGVVYTKEALREVNQICRGRRIYHISDETYEYFTYNGIKHYSPGAFAESNEYTISLFSLSKAYGFASWRIGYMVIPEHLFTAVKKIQDTILICPPVISQYAALGALQVGVSYCQNYLSQITAVRELMLNSLESIKDLCRIAPADGAFYFFLKVDTKLSDFKLVERLIQEYRVAVLPGTTFGINEGCCLRVAYGALQQEIAAEGIRRLVQGIQETLSS
ncbi:MAG: pyridoxal phosphate-dependent aminotransferase [Symploca sp. SIO2E9]|nr:pyridoxal phosphate-dependent aminotransferase [Symploca sp. SIO2E9]